MPLSENEIRAVLEGTTFGRPQSVGVMDVLPIVEDEDLQDDGFAPPNFEAGTSEYGRVDVRNLDPERPTIIPTGTGFVTKEYAQDHALPSGKLMKPGERYSCLNAMCIQESQGGLIRHSDKTPMVILPMELRYGLIKTRKEREYSRMWPSIRAFLQHLGLGRRSGNLVDFMNHFKTELEQFVAEFELVPNQVGAVIFINNHLVGIERAPNAEYWAKVWDPLVRICYGSAALLAAQKQVEFSRFRALPMPEDIGDLTALKVHLDTQREVVEEQVKLVGGELKSKQLRSGDAPDSVLEDMTLTTVLVGGGDLVGQIVSKGSRVPYASLASPK